MTAVERNGLNADLEKWQETQRKAAVRYAEKRRAAVVVSREGAKVTARRAPKRSRNDWSPEVRALARARSGGVCELCQEARAEHLHHRKSRRNKDHRIVNALHVCHHCHGQIHAAPKRAAQCGWIVHSLMRPEKVPAILVGRVLLLTDNGDYADVPAAEDVAS